MEFKKIVSELNYKQILQQSKFSHKLLHNLTDS